MQPADTGEQPARFGVSDSPGTQIMAQRKHFEQAAASIAALGRSELKQRIRNFKGRFKLDFTDDYLEKLSLEKLRHILLAALMSSKR